jgi:hypothetical protein
VPLLTVIVVIGLGSAAPLRSPCSSAPSGGTDDQQFRLFAT